MDKKVVVDIDAESGSIALDGALYIGETVDLEFEGFGEDDGKPRIYVLDYDGVTSIADNSEDEDVLNLKGAELRKRFIEKRGVKTFKVIALGPSDTDDVFASGLVAIRWSPVVYDADFVPATLKGDKGEKGDTGAALTYDMLTTQQKAELKGEKGDRGAQGIQGPQGLTGIQGRTGEQGPKGDKGDKGDTGEKGDKGETGEQGPKGDDGEDGIQEERVTEIVSDAVSAIPCMLVESLNKDPVTKFKWYDANLGYCILDTSTTMAMFDCTMSAVLPQGSYRIAALIDVESDDVGSLTSSTAMESGSRIKFDVYMKEKITFTRIVELKAGKQFILSDEFTVGTSTSRLLRPRFHTFMKKTGTETYSGAHHLRAKFYGMYVLPSTTALTENLVGYLDFVRMKTLFPLVAIGGGDVRSVNGKSGAVALEAEDVGAVASVEGKGLSANDYTDSEKAKLASLKVKPDEAVHADSATTATNADTATTATRATTATTATRATSAQSATKATKADHITDEDTLNRLDVEVVDGVARPVVTQYDAEGQGTQRNVALVSDVPTTAEQVGAVAKVGNTKVYATSDTNGPYCEIRPSFGGIAGRNSDGVSFLLNGSRIRIGNSDYYWPSASFAGGEVATHYNIKSVVNGELKDATVNTASAGGTFTFPARNGSIARDFILVVRETVPTETGPTVVLDATGVSFVSDDENVFSSEANKVNVWFFTEIESGVFAVAHKAFAPVTQ